MSSTGIAVAGVPVDLVVDGRTPWRSSSGTSRSPRRSASVAVASAPRGTARRGRRSAPWAGPRIRSPRMLCWISSVPPAIETAGTDTRTSAIVPPSGLSAPVSIPEAPAMRAWAARRGAGDVAAGELAERALRAGRAAERPRRRGPLRGPLRHAGEGDHAGDLLAHDRIGVRAGGHCAARPRGRRGRPAADTTCTARPPRPARRPPRVPRGRPRVPRRARAQRDGCEAPLVGERGQRDRPAVADRADDVVARARGRRRGRPR